MRLLNWTYLLWSKNSIERLMISSSAMILLSSSATSPRSSFDPLAAGGKTISLTFHLLKNGIEYYFIRNFFFKNPAFTINRWMRCIKVSSSFHFIWGTNVRSVHQNNSTRSTSSLVEQLNKWNDSSNWCWFPTLVLESPMSCSNTPISTQ